MVSENLEDKIIIITGGVGLIGRALSRVCAEEKMNVVIADINEKAGNEFTKQLITETKNKEIVFKTCNITDEKEVGNLATDVVERFGKIDCLVNNAYPKNKNYGRKFENVTYKDFCDNVNLHLGGYFLVTKKISEKMIQQQKGNIINMASIYGFAAPRFDIYQGTDMTTPVEYAAIKGAIINLTKYFAAYLGRHGIRVNSISPGGIFDNQPKSFVEKYSKKVVIENRMANTEDIEGVLKFLVSDSSRYITGQNIIVDGGWTL